MNRGILLGFASAMTLASACPVSSALAETATVETAPAGATQLGEIVVTAQRREESSQKAALSVVAVKGTELAARGVVTMEQLSQLAPGLEVTPSGGPYTTFTIRSVSNLSGNAFADPAVAVNYAGVYLATPTVLHGLFFDLDRVEVLKGPQGTLYGRNATAGAINVVPHRADFQFGAQGSVDFGNYGKVNTAGMVNLPISDKLAARVAFQTVHHDGYYSDGTGDDNGQAVRVSLRYDPTSTLSINLYGDYAYQGGHGPGASIREVCANGQVCFPLGAFTGIGDSGSLYVLPTHPETTPNYQRSYYRGVAANIDWKVADGTLTVIPAYRSSNVGYLTTSPGFLLTERQHPDQSSIEARFASGAVGRLKYVVGGYYLATHMVARANGESAAGGTFSDQHTNLKGWTAAGFGQASFSLTDTLRLTGGVRYTYEEKTSDSVRYTVRTIVPNIVIPYLPLTAPALTAIGTKSWSATNWKGGFEWDAGPQSLVYANVSTGFKAGGFYYGVPGNITYDPEHVTAYTVGTKNRFLENRLQLNAEAFYLDYTNQQVSFVQLINGSAVLVTKNAGKVQTKGIEVEAAFIPWKNTRLGLDVDYLDAKYDSFVYTAIGPNPAKSRCISTPGTGGFSINCSGLPALRSPPWSVNGSLQQTLPLATGAALIGELLVHYKDPFESDVNYLPETRTNAATRVDVSLTYRSADGRWSARAYADNVGNARTLSYIQSNLAYSVLPFSAAVIEPPRTFGVRLTAGF